MLKDKTIQTHLHTVIYNQRNFTKFCYFFIAFILISCKNETTTEKITEANVPTTTETEAVTTTSKKTILFFGDSITAGYGLDDTNDAFPAIIQAKIDSVDLGYQVVNSGLSGETSSGGKSRIQWVLNQDIDVFVLELGANDGLRGVPLSETRANLQAIVDAVKTKNTATKIIIAGMQLPPNMGQEYISEFKVIFSNLAEKNDLPLIPFILKDVGGIPSLNQSDGIHPTIEGHKIVANTVWEVVKPILIEE